MDHKKPHLMSWDLCFYFVINKKAENLKVGNQFLFSCSVKYNSATAACQASISFTISWSLLKLMSVELVMLSSYLILCCPLLLLPSIFPSIRIFSNESTLRIRGSKYWSFSFNISPSNEHSGLISFVKGDQLDQGDLVGSPCCPRDSQEFSPTPQFKSINSLTLSFLYSPAFTSLHNYWKNHSFA